MTVGRSYCFMACCYCRKRSCWFYWDGLPPSAASWDQHPLFLFWLKWQGCISCTLFDPSLRYCRSNAHSRDGWQLVFPWTTITQTSTNNSSREAHYKPHIKMEANFGNLTNICISLLLTSKQLAVHYVWLWLLCLLLIARYLLMSSWTESAYILLISMLLNVASVRLSIDDSFRSFPKRPATPT
jgi:hypothetical protein